MSKNGLYTLEGGSKAWYLHSRYHRENGPAIEGPDGHNEWYLHGKLHRTDGPAVEYSNGVKQWYLAGKLHREDGPAIEYPDGTRYWFLNGRGLSEEEYLRADTSKYPKLKVYQVIRS